MADRRFAARTRWHLRVGALVAGWLLAAVAVAVRGLVVGVDAWLPVHLLLLGAVSTAILVWSTYFAEALLRRPAPPDRRAEGARLVLFTTGALAVMAGMTFDGIGAVVGGACLVVAAVVWHATVLLRRMRLALPSRFGTTVRYYVAASLLLPVGVTIGVVMEGGDLDDELHARLVLAHVVVNVLGWMVLTVAGTLVTLWPTMLHTQVADDAERVARRALPGLVVLVLATAALAALGLRAAAGVALLAYAVALGKSGRPLLAEARRRQPTSYATWSVAAAVLWLLVSVTALGVAVATAGSWESAVEVAERVDVPLLVGFAAQLLVGALTYLVPVVLGGGPATARATIAVLERGRRTRLVLVNLGVAAVLVPVPVGVRMVLWWVGLAALATFLPLLLHAVQVRRAGSPAGV